VFNPTLFEHNEDAKEMELRYASIFSEHLRKRIEFRPDFHAASGKFSQFVNMIRGHKHEFFF
jgi:hypothetical protein